MATLAEVEEALRHTADVPADQRGEPWHAYVDGLLVQRETLMLELSFKEPSCQ